MNLVILKTKNNKVTFVFFRKQNFKISVKDTKQQFYILYLFMLLKYN